MRIEGKNERKSVILKLRGVSVSDQSSYWREREYSCRYCVSAGFSLSEPVVSEKL